jgi:Fic family protein
MEEALLRWEEFLLRDDSLAPLVKCALMHYQFEAIHPFLDGNGRVGRLLITLYLCEKGHLDHPVLYLSDYFEKQRDEYYRLLLQVSAEGRWDSWLRYFVRGVAEQSRVALETGNRILALQKEFRRRLEENAVPPSAFRLMDMLFLNPFVSLPGISDTLKVTWPTAKASVERLVKLGILSEVSGRRRNRIYCARELLTVLASRGT